VLDELVSITSGHNQGQAIAAMAPASAAVTGVGWMVMRWGSRGHR